MLACDSSRAHVLACKSTPGACKYKPVSTTDCVFAMHAALHTDTDAGTAFFVLFEETLYFLSVISVGLWFIWITWLPFLDWLAPPAATQGMLQGTTTISDTFRRYSTVSTVYMSGPLTILFVFRIYRTFRSELLVHTKKNVAVFLILVQYSLFVIIRYDHIYGPTHGAFVLVTVLLLMYYHYSVQFISTQHSTLALYALVRKEKQLLGALALFLLTAFAVLIIADQIHENHIVYFCACICEIFGIIFLGGLDVIDIRYMRRLSEAAVFDPPTHSGSVVLMPRT
jgi:hypothetical protein